MTRKFEKFYRIIEFIDVFHKLLKSNDNVRLFLLGSGSLENKIKSKIIKLNISNYIHMPGWVNRKEMNNYLNSSDIYISNSYTDGSSVSLLEAIACGLSPIVTKIESIEEWVEDGYNGYLVDIDNPEEMEKKIMKLTISAKKMVKFKQRNIDLSKNKLDWEINFKILENIYSNLLK
tara:strand:- start:14 stop:541 length:528 start_codon:yes stop_codon:yes gene_type:complete